MKKIKLNIGATFLRKGVRYESGKTYTMSDEAAEELLSVTSPESSFPYFIDLDVAKEIAAIEEKAQAAAERVRAKSKAAKDNPEIIEADGEDDEPMQKPARATRKPAGEGAAL
jgi:hypothetical protein